ncbi:MAG: methyl-accepting chemotaxis protein [Sneathiellales bacterium]|nr:methyl-accepting chemotaxis protein [Sneathiellales bacterium]
MKTIRQKLLVLFLGILLLSNLSLVFTTTTVSSDTAQENTTELLKADAAYESAQVKQIIEAAYHTAKALGATVEAMMASGVAERDAIAAIAIRTVEDNPQLIGATVAFEPNGNGKDNQFKGDAYSDETGRFVPYFFRQKDGKVGIEKLIMTKEAGIDGWYTVPLEANEAIVTEPYIYPVEGVDVLMTTISIPIRNAKGDAIGIVTSDIAMTDLQKTMADVKPLNAGFIKLTSPDGLYIYTPETEKLGTKTTSVPLLNALGSVAKGQIVEFEGSAETGDAGSHTKIIPISFEGLNAKWALVYVVPDEAVFASANEVRNVTMIVAAIVIFVAVAIVWFMANGISAPITRMTKAMNIIAGGDFKSEVPAQDRSDEIGQMAAAVETFRQNGIENTRLQKEAEETRETERLAKERRDAERQETEARLAEERKTAEEQAAKERADALHNMADSFESEVGSLISQLSDAASEMKTSAELMTKTADRASERSHVVSSASEEAASSVNSVSAATEELSSSIQEISRQVTTSAGITSRAVDEANNTNDTMNSLASSAQRIGEVVGMINDIAEQTNLLALNATIEDARAGEAGKGFAVVASEVKNLASQTAKATEEITGQISGMQNVTTEAVGAIENIVKTISEISEVTSSISAAVEEQGAATGEIARSAQTAAQGTTEVNSNIGEVSQAAGEAGTAAGTVLHTATNLEGYSTELRGKVDQFLTNVRS